MTASVDARAFSAWRSGLTAGVARLPAVGGVLTIACIGAAWLLPWNTPLLAAAAAIAMALEYGRWRRIGTLAARIEGMAGIVGDGAPQRRLDHALGVLEGVVDRVNHRFSHRHRLTGLATREPLFAAIEADARNGAHPSVLGVVDFADFDRLNAFDSALADRALSVIAERVVRMIGRSRLVAHVDRARIAIWFGPATPVERARAELDAIGYALADGIDDGRGLVPLIRIGWAHSPGEGATPQALLTRAIACAVTAGETVEACDPTEAARASFDLEQDLRHAVARGQFELAFQPLIDAAGQRVCGAEALLRWNHPAHGRVSPADFVPIVEAAGLAQEVGLWALNAACREARQWRQQRLDGLRVAVNISAHQLEHDGLATVIERTLARHRLPGQVLEIELTETVAAGDARRANAFFDTIRQLGAAIAIDDFGTGYSSLSSIRQLKFDKVKIDREFVTEVDRRPDSQAICQSVIALGRGLGIRVLAEGVERAEEYQWLRRHGCTLFQGFYFAPPLSGRDFADFVRDRAGLDQLLRVSPGAMQDAIENRMRI